MTFASKLCAPVLCACHLLTVLNASPVPAVELRQVISREHPAIKGVDGG